MGTVRDITKRKQIEKEQRKLYEETNTLLDSLRFDEANKLIKEAVSISEEAKSDEYINHFLLKLVQVYINDKKLNKAKDLLIKTHPLDSSYLNKKLIIKANTQI
ncbi:unnamed protein product [marine sediment metagenome]|uniref:PAC domain-containing protein n=1 Tax=marine sediment metagenome TaxID=412755 RepID=X1HWD2_9ZZZZ